MYLKSEHVYEKIKTTADKYQFTSKDTFETMTNHADLHLLWGK